MTYQSTQCFFKRMNKKKFNGSQSVIQLEKFDGVRGNLNHDLQKNTYGEEVQREFYRDHKKVQDFSNRFLLYLGHQHKFVCPLITCDAIMTAYLQVKWDICASHALYATGFKYLLYNLHAYEALGKTACMDKSSCGLSKCHPTFTSLSILTNLLRVVTFKTGLNKPEIESRIE